MQPPPRPCALSNDATWRTRLMSLAQFLLPTRCALCGAIGREGLCRHCDWRYFQQEHPGCAQCGLQLASPKPHCGKCLRDKPHFDVTIAAAHYAPPLDQLVLDLKFSARMEVAPLFARQIAKQIKQGNVALPDYLVPMPLSSARMVERGFNQAVEIARPLAKILDIPLVIDAAVRTRNTAAQSLLHPDQRQRNIAKAFAIKPGISLDGAHIGIVDDVMTTGATLGALAALLKMHGASHVTNFVFARTQPT